MLTRWLLKSAPVRIVHGKSEFLNIFLYFVYYLVICPKAVYLVYYLFLRASLRMAVGKARRNIYLTNKNFRFNYGLDVQLIFSLLRFFYRTGFLPQLYYGYAVRIYVPKYDYKAYCPLNNEDFINLTIREDKIIEKFQPRPGDTVVDVGAHFGRYSMIASKLVGPTGKVIAIEPDPSNFELLCRNIELNKLRNVECLNIAIYSRDTKLKLYLTDREEGKSIYNSVMVDRAPTREKFVETEATSLDSLLRSNSINVEDVRWIKIDVEGAELEVLRGARLVLSKKRDISILVEIHNLSSGTPYDSISDLLGSYGFKIEFEISYSTGERHILTSKRIQGYQPEGLEKN